jgi:pimeloyl-ACP methyl ester carboxylesterase
MAEQKIGGTTINPSRRTFLEYAAAMGLGGLAIAQGKPARADIVQTDFSTLPPYGNGTIPAGIRSRHVANVNGLTVHILEAGYETPGRPAVLLLHGFPELAYSWRKVMPSLAAAGYHVIAPDQRGYGRTTGWDNSYDADQDPFRILNMTRDAIGLVYALGHRTVAMVVGHDAGAPVAAWSALIRPDIFRSLTIMSSPFEGAPSLPFATASGETKKGDTANGESKKGDTASGDAANGALLPPRAITDDELDAELAKLTPPRKYYQNYQRTRGAGDDMLHAPQGLHAFFRAYYFYKSADYKGNHPHPLKARTAEEMAQIPTYYVMEKDKGMAATVAQFMPPADYIANCKWLTEPEVEVYATEYGRTGFTGALQGYRVRRGSDARSIAEMQTFSGLTIDVPSQFIDGKSDWGAYQTPGAIDKMRKSACTRMAGFHFLDGAGHWVQQEQPEQVSALLIQFLYDYAKA